MALPRPPGLLPDEVGFLCEMELVTVIPRQRLDSLQLLGGPTERLNPPFPAQLPLWLALLLKRQKRGNISPPPWMSVEALTAILDFETDTRAGGVFSPGPEMRPAASASTPGDGYLRQDRLETSPPFVKDSCSSRAQDNALPYHWLELSHLLLSHASDDFDDPESVRNLIRDLREVRMSKLRKGFRVLESGAGVKMNGVGGMEVAEVRGFVGGVVDGLRKINHSREEAQRDRAASDRDGLGDGNYEDDDNEMEL